MNAVDPEIPSTEYGIVGALLDAHDSDRADIAGEVKAEWLTIQAARQVFAAAQKLALRGLDCGPNAVCDALNVDAQHPLWEVVWGAPEYAPSRGRWRELRDTLRRRYWLRGLQREAAEFNRQVSLASPYDCADLPMKAEALAKYAGDDEGSADVVTLGEVMPERVQRVKDLHAGVREDIIKCGIPLFDSTMPILGKLVHTVAARPSQGKTALMVAMARGMVSARPDCTVLFVSVEETVGGLADRIWAGEAQVDSRMMVDPKRHAGPRNENIDALMGGAARVRNFAERIGLYEKRGATWQHICRVARRFYRRCEAYGRPLSAIFVDYVQKCGDENRRADRIERIENAMNGFEVLAGETGAAVIMGSQLNRDGAKTKDRDGVPVPEPEHAFGGDSIFHTSAWMQMLVHPAQHERGQDTEGDDSGSIAPGFFDPHLLYVYVGKNRRGVAKGRRFRLRVDFATGNFGAYTDRRDEWRG